ncbi:CLIP domain-containing serine protease B15-like [Lutzomyia longipalpis]|uniref:CLIP domain-containing serine protease B15-like n=1 Tax=Lutzomyia longipalpis TaxID=7200 RepID=UPI0024842E18|nr:CLIP domain-containing serine protease B15-like [Lutzomyia longipalpis]
MSQLGTFLIFLTIITRSLCEMGYLGLAIEAGSICPNGSLLLSREIGRPPKTENYWDGQFFFDQWPSIPEVRLKVTLDAPARMEIDPDVGRIDVRGRSFIITTFESPPKLESLKFTVRGRRGGKFPNVASVHLNGENICPNPTPFKPTLLGVSSSQENEDFSDAKKVNRVDSLRECGKRKIEHQGLITYGADTHPGDFPWHAAIYHLEGQRRTYKCGGTIINTHTIITAGHCVFEGSSLITAERIIVQVGKYHLNVADDTTKEFRVFSIIPHPQYNTSNLANDIALLRLSREIIYTDHIQPICLWASNATTNLRDIENRMATAVGWGSTENDTLSDVLRYTEIPIVPTLTCLQSDRDFFGFFLSETNFCGGYLNGTNVCSGDSGGSLAIEDEHKVWRIRGIISLSVRRRDKDICNPKHYVIFTDVAKYLPWIEQESSRRIREE